MLIDDRDGSNVQRSTATDVILKVGGQIKFKNQKASIDLFISDARFALACSNFNEGGGHAFFVGSGVLFAAEGVNAVSKIHAKVHSRGKMLVGQVRYPWLRRIGSSAKAGFGTFEKLYLGTFVKGGGSITITLNLQSRMSAAQIAAEVARRAAHYRLATKDADGQHRETLEELTFVRAHADGNSAREIHWHTLPGADSVDETSARLSPATA